MPIQGRDLIEFITTPATFPCVITHVAQAGPVLKAMRLRMNDRSTPSQVEERADDHFTISLIDLYYLLKASGS